MQKQRKHFNKKALLKNIGKDDNFIKMLLEIYFVSFETFMDTNKKAIENDDKELSKRTIHSIKGSSGTIYFEIMTDLFEELSNVEINNKNRIIDLIIDIEKEYYYIRKNIYIFV